MIKWMVSDQKVYISCLFGCRTPRETVDSIRRCEFNLVFCSSESIMRTHRKIFRGPFKQFVDIVVVDKSHCHSLNGKHILSLWSSNALMLHVVLLLFFLTHTFCKMSFSHMFFFKLCENLSYH